MQRTEALRVKLSDDMMARFKRVSVDYGIPEPTLAAFALSEFVLRRELVFKRVGSGSGAVAQAAAVGDSPACGRAPTDRASNAT